MSTDPNPGLIFDTLSAFQQTGALKAAIELKLFTILGEEPLTADAIAEECGADPRGVRILCDFLTSYEFLEKHNDMYSLTPTSATYLDEGSPAYMGSVASFIASDEILDTFRDVAGAVRKGGTLLPEGGSTKPDFDLWVEFARSMAPMMHPAAHFIADIVANEEPDEEFHVLDLAAGHGLFGITIAQRLMNAQIVAQDWEAVVGLAHENARMAGVSDRYATLPGDAMSIDFGGPYDCILLTNFLHHFDSEVCKTLLIKVRESLKPGGLVLTLEFVPDESRVSPRTPATFALTMLTSTGAGDAYTFSEYQQMFHSAGFWNTHLFDIPRSQQRLIVSRNSDY